jgi:hypothetical protein
VKRQGESLGVVPQLSGEVQHLGAVAVLLVTAEDGGLEEGRHPANPQRKQVAIMMTHRRSLASEGSMNARFGLMPLERRSAGLLAFARGQYPPTGAVEFTYGHLSRGRGECG